MSGSWASGGSLREGEKILAGEAEGGGVGSTGPTSEDSANAVHPRRSAFMRTWPDLGTARESE